MGGTATNPPGGSGPSGPAPKPEAAPTPPAAEGGAASDPATERRVAVEQRRAAERAKGAVEGQAARVPSGPAVPKARPSLSPAMAQWAETAARLLPETARDESTFDVPALRVAPDRLLDVCRKLRHTPELHLEYLTCVSGVDYADHVEIVYHLFSVAHPERALVLKVDAPKAGGDGEAEVPSVTEFWPGANWHEREIFDLFGVRFPGHPDLRRILMPEGFDGGYPLRKDYVDAREQRRRKVRQR